MHSSTLKTSLAIALTAFALVACQTPVTQEQSGMVIGGLIVSTLLTLVIVPAGFSLADGVEKRVGPWLSRKLLTYKTGDNADDEALMAGLDKPRGIQPAE